MLRVALTGGLCCGKSTVAAVLVSLGCPVIDADRIGHTLLEKGSDAYNEAVAAFGRGILTSEGTVDRKRLAAVVFKDEKARSRLNSILHPRILSAIDRQLNELEAQGHPIAVVEAALFVEVGAHERFDRLIVVICEAEQKVRRFQARGAGTRADAMARISTQMPDEQKARLADFVIDNSGSLDRMRKQVEEVYAILRHDATAEAS